MSDAESRYEDAKRDRWEDAHAGEFDQPCPDCGNDTARLVDRQLSSRLEPGYEVWACPCGHEGEGQ